MNKEFEIRSYGKSELALLYFPHAKTTKGAMNNLNFWIDYNGELRRKLRELSTSESRKNVPRKAQDSTSVYRNHGGMLYLCTCIQEAAYFVKVTRRTGPRKGSPYSE